ncbi:hypothetical protein V5799_018957 [Amblyomma americanum]|uniref:Uncharacterized protein n=1 Tax=Amblyomma americanum TaxID=6943 RepID=A0AAQ4EZ44_AMBAM
MSNKYRLLTRTGTKTGSGGMQWKFYWDLHRFLGSLPANDSTLMEESGCSAIDGTSPEEVFTVTSFGSNWCRCQPVELV